MGKKKNQKSAGGNQPPQATTDKGGNMDNPGCKGLEGVRSSGEEDSENAIPTVHRSHPEGLRNENSMASDAYTTRRVTGNWRGDDLVSFTREQWPTITSSEHKHRMRGNSQQSHGLTTTARKSPIHSSPQGQMKQISGGSSSDIFRGLNQPIARNPSHQCSPKCRRLNPNFVEQLQGLLPGWTDPTLDYGSWEMELFRVHARLLFESSQLN